MFWRQKGWKKCLNMGKYQLANYFVIILKVYFRQWGAIKKKTEKQTRKKVHLMDVEVSWTAMKPPISRVFIFNLPGVKLSFMKLCNFVRKSSPLNLKSDMQICNQERNDLKFGLNRNDWSCCSYWVVCFYISASLVCGGKLFVKIAWQKIHNTRVDESSSKCHIFVREAVRCKKQKQERSRDLFL